MTTTAAPVRKSALAQRLKPAGAAGIGIAVLALNVVMLITMERFYPVGTMLGTVLIFTGVVGVILGEPEDAYGNRPMWFKATMVGAAIVGLLVGLGINIALASD